MNTKGAFHQEPLTVTLKLVALLHHFILNQQNIGWLRDANNMEDKGVLFMGTGPSPSDRPQTTPGIVVPLAFFASIGLTTLVLFCCVRKFFKDIYLPRLYLTPAHKIPPYLSKGFLSWVPKLLAVKESDIISTLGLDAVTFLRFLWMGFRLFGLLSLLGMGFLAPVNFYAEEPSFANSTGFLYEDVLLPSLSVNNVPNRSPYLWVHLLFTWVFSLCAIGFLVSFYRETLSSKLKYETRILKETLLNRIDGRSIMVFGIPRDLRREIELAAYFDSLGIGRVENGSHFWDAFLG